MRIISILSPKEDAMAQPAPDLQPSAAHRPGGWLAAYWRPEVAPLSPRVQAALAAGPRPAELFLSSAQAPALMEDGYGPVETGWTWTRGQGVRVNCLTPMPGVTPAMWDWWFAWHGADSDRYKLWHPRAHLAVGWADGGDARGGYVGRTSRVVEYLGASRMRFAISFEPPAAFGLDPALLARKGQVAVCARAGLDGSGFTSGAMIHQLRPTADGCEMRSRFWMLGDDLRLGGLRRPLTRLIPPRPQEAEALLVHCAEEMGHLAGILPALYAEFGADQ